MNFVEKPIESITKTIIESVTTSGIGMAGAGTGAGVGAVVAGPPGAAIGFVFGFAGGLAGGNKLGKIFSGFID